MPVVDSAPACAQQSVVETARNNSKRQLADLAQQINAEHIAVLKAAEAAAAAAEGVVTHVLAAGRALIKAKAAVNHGEWTIWLKRHCQVGERQAQRYMKLTENFDQNRHSVSDLAGQSLRGLMRLLAPPENPPRAAGSSPSFPKTQITSPAAKVEELKPEKRTTCDDIWEAWENATPEERGLFVRCVGPEILECIPAEWLEVVPREQPVIEDRQEQPVAAIQSDWKPYP